jgi:hypothetical protein
MAILRNAGNAVIDERKIRDYALNMNSADGRHKARVIRAATGLTRENYREVIDQIRQAILVSEAEPIEPTPYGLRFSVAMTISGPTGSLRVRTAWIYRSGKMSHASSRSTPTPRPERSDPSRNFELLQVVYARRARPDLGVCKGDSGTIVEVFDVRVALTTSSSSTTTAPPARKGLSPRGIWRRRHPRHDGSCRGAGAGLM